MTDPLRSLQANPLLRRDAVEALRKLLHEWPKRGRPCWIRGRHLTAPFPATVIMSFQSKWRRAGSSWGCNR